MYKNILVPIDVYEDKLIKSAIYTIEQLAKISDAHIHLLYVTYRVPDLARFRIPAKDLDFAQNNIINTSQRDINNVAKLFSLPDDRLHLHIKTGAPRDKILSLAEEIKADLIVIGSRHPSISTYLLGSTASAVVRYSNTHVLVIR